MGSLCWQHLKLRSGCRHKNLLLQRYDKMKTKPRAEKTALALVAGEGQQVQAAWGNARRQIALREELLAREKQAPALTPKGQWPQYLVALCI